VSDARLRRLDRAARGGGAAARARHVRALRRAGDLAAARRLLVDHLAPPGRPGAPGPPRGFDEWLTALEAWGPEATIRAAVAAARRVHPLWEAARPADPRPAEAIRAAEDWLGAPDRDRAAAARAAAEDVAVAATAADGESLLLTGEDRRAAWAATRAARAAGLAAEAAALAERDPAAAVARAAAALRAPLAETFDLAPRDAVEGPDLREAVRRELLPWATGAGDPLAARREVARLPVRVSLPALGLGGATESLLASWRVFHVRELLRRTRHQLLEIPGFGDATVDRIEDALARHGLRLDRGPA